jgi:hypothetical protein
VLLVAVRIIAAFYTPAIKDACPQPGAFVYFKGKKLINLKFYFFIRVFKIVF